jgi:RNA polymerase sigma-70 factor (ECF subfamily)
VSVEADVSDDAGFVELVRDLERPIGAFLAQMTSDRSLAADLMQETFLVAWRERSRIPADAAQHRAWVYGVARNRALHALRRERRRVVALNRLVSRSGLEGPLEAHDEALAMRDLLVRTLRPADRSLFVLRYVHGFDGPELAQLAGLKPEAVRKRLQRASERLARACELLEESTVEEETAHVHADASI